MLSIREIQEKTVGFFTGKGVPNPKLDADLLLSHVLGLKRLELYLDIERPLTEAQLDELRPLVKRRAAREPLQYILGTTEFCGMALKVDSRALIPRQETEELVELIRDRMRVAPKNILDLGTGSGAIAIALALAYPEVEVWATDQSEAALSLARENAQNYVSDNRIHFHQGSWWDALPEGVSFDLIVSNPPYLTEAEMKTAEPEVVDNEPSNALVSGADGLGDLRQIINAAPKYLADGGLLALETGIAQHDELDELCAKAGLKGQGILDMSGRPRFYFAGAPLEDAQGCASGVASGHASAGTCASAVPTVGTVGTVGTGASEATEVGANSRRESLKRLRSGRLSIPNARYFITCCTTDREKALTDEAPVTRILSTLEELHSETSIDLLTATVMPDHVHLLFKLGRRLELAQVIGKFKAATKQALASSKLEWQDNYYDHRLRADDAVEKFSKYIFLNPYRAELVSIEEPWPWWILNDHYRPEFVDLLNEPPLPPAEWLSQAVGLDELLDGDRFEVESG